MKHGSDIIGVWNLLQAGVKYVFSNLWLLVARVM